MSFENILGRPGEPTTEKTVWRKAYELIEQNGWTQGAAQRNGCLCAGGAIAKALGYDADEMWDAHRHPEMKRAFERFGDHVGTYRGYDSRMRVYDFNDANHRTEEDVLKALEELDDMERASK